MKSIKEFKGNYFFLSNFYEAPVVYDGFSYRNNEAAFQAQKCCTYEEMQRFTTLNPSEAKRLGRRVKLRDNWEQIKEQRMYEICYCKFKLNPDLLDKLLKTGDAYLEEGNDWGDKYWGTVNGEGKNALGKILMRLRENFKNEGY